MDILGQAFALAQQRVGISVPGATPTEPPSTNAQPSKPQQPATTPQIWNALLEIIGSEEDILGGSPFWVRFGPFNRNSRTPTT